MIISIFTSPSTLWITISTRARTPQLVCILRNIGLLELQSIVCQIHIEKESDVWFGRHSQWLAQLADLPRQPFGLVFSLRSMQTSWGVLTSSCCKRICVKRSKYCINKTDFLFVQALTKYNVFSCLQRRQLKLDERWGTMRRSVEALTYLNRNSG